MVEDHQQEPCHMVVVEPLDQHHKVVEQKKEPQVIMATAYDMDFAFGLTSS